MIYIRSANMYCCNVFAIKNVLEIGGRHRNAEIVGELLSSFRPAPHYCGDFHIWQAAHVLRVNLSHESGAHNGRIDLFRCHAKEYMRGVGLYIQKTRLSAPARPRSTS